MHLRCRTGPSVQQGAATLLDLPMLGACVVSAGIEGVLGPHRAHLAAAVTEYLLSDEVVERATAHYWRARQGVTLDAWMPPIDQQAMRAALAAALGVER